MVDTSSRVVTFIPRPSHERGHADHGWLKSYHSFAFAGYFPSEPIHHSFGPLRVINEDWVMAGQGFGTHSHREFEIFSYVLSGQLEHRDSMQNLEVMKRGDLQMTSAGTGIAHSEYNHQKRGGEPCRFLQIWAKPSARGLQPKYYTRHFSDQDKLDKLVQIVGPDNDASVIDEREADGPAPVHSNMRVYSSLLSPGKSVEKSLREDTKKVYVHNVLASGYRDAKDPAPANGSKVTVTSGGARTELVEGDALYAIVEKPGEASFEISSTGGTPAELIFFEMSE